MGRLGGSLGVFASVPMLPTPCLRSTPDSTLICCSCRCTTCRRLRISASATAPAAAAAPAGAGPSAGPPGAAPRAMPFSRSNAARMKSMLGSTPSRASGEGSSTNACTCRRSTCCSASVSSVRCTTPLPPWAASAPSPLLPPPAPPLRSSASSCRSSTFSRLSWRITTSRSSSSFTSTLGQDGAGGST